MAEKRIMYTVGEEIFNAVTHGVGAAISIAACVLMIIKAAIGGSPIQIVSVSIFGASMIVLYTISTLYHSLTNKKAKKVFQILDHCSIFILIAGTYTPYTLVAMKGALGWSIFGILWGVTVIGVILNALGMEKFKHLSMVLYIVMGWCVVFVVKPVYEHIGFWGFLLLLGGGIFYTVGIIFYTKNKIRYMHSIWHIFVVLGTTSMILSVLFFLIK